MYPAAQDSYGTFLKSTPVQIPILLLSEKQGGGGTCMNICRGFIGCVEHHVYSVTSDRPLKGGGGGWGLRYDSNQRHPRHRRSAKQVRQPTLNVRLDFVGSPWRVTSRLLVVQFEQAA